MLSCTCEGTVTGFGLASPQLFGERDQARQMLEHQPAVLRPSSGRWRTSSASNATAAASPPDSGRGSCSASWRSTPRSGTTGR